MLSQNYSLSLSSCRARMSWMCAFIFLSCLFGVKPSQTISSSRASKTKEIRTKEMTAGKKSRPFLNEEEEEATNTTTTTAALPRDVLVVRVFARK